MLLPLLEQRTSIDRGDAMVTPEEIRRIADLARISVPDDKLATYAEQLERILDYVGMLGELDTSAVEPMMHATANDNVFRADEPGTCLDRAVALSNAPDHDAVYFRVPKTL